MRNYIVPIVTRYASVFVQFAVVAVVTHALDKTDAGRYFVIMGLVLATYFVAGFGLPDGMVRFAPALAATNRRGDAEYLLWKGTKISLGTVPVGAVLCGLAAATYTGSNAVALFAALWWAAYGTIFVCAQAIVASGRSDLGTAMFYSAANAGQLCITAPWILAGGLHQLDTVLLSTAVGTSATALVCLIVAARTCRRSAATALDLSEIWKQGVTIATGRVVQSCFLWSPVWVVSFTLGAADAALVGLASRLVSAVAAVLAALRFSIRPRLSREAAQGNWQAIQRHASTIAFFTTALALCAIAVCALFGDFLISRIFGGGYHGAGMIMALMLIGTVGESFGGPVDEVLKMAGHAGHFLVAQVVVLVIGFGAQILAAQTGNLIPLVITYSLMFVIFYLSLIALLWHLRKILIVPRLYRGAE